jgi:hypothetical protein
MIETRTYAWIMYALAGASQNEPANFAAISQVADGINHAVPTHKELQLSLEWLMGNGLAQKQGSRYLLTEKGYAVMASICAEQKTISQIWSSLTCALNAAMSKL